MRFEVIIDDPAELIIAKALGAKASDEDNCTALHEEIHSADDVPSPPLSHEASGELISALARAAQTTEGMDVGVSPTIADGILRTAGVNVISNASS